MALVVRIICSCRDSGYELAPIRQPRYLCLVSAVELFSSCGHRKVEQKTVVAPLACPESKYSPVILCHEKLVKTMAARMTLRETLGFTSTSDDRPLFRDDGKCCALIERCK